MAFICVSIMSDTEGMSSGVGSSHVKVLEPVLAGKTALKRRFTSLTLKVNAISRRLKSALDKGGLSPHFVTCFKEDCDHSNESLSNLHADIVEFPDLVDELESSVIDLEDLLFSLREECLEATSNSRKDPSVSDRSVLNPALPPPPGPKLTLDSFDGDILKFWSFKQRFKRHIEGVYANWEDRLAFLESLCEGKAKNAISGLSCLLDSKDAYLKAWDRLDYRFGDTQKLMSRLRQELLHGPAIKDGDGDSLSTLADKMFQCEMSFAGWNKIWMLDSPELMHGLFERLPYKLKTQFVSGCAESGKFKDLRILVERAASEATSEFGVLLHQGKANSYKNKAALSKPTRNEYVCSAQQMASRPPQVVDNKSCVFCNEFHCLWKCSQFKLLSPKERLSFAKDKNLCFNCLRRDHRVSKCLLRISCRECGKRHNTLLHLEHKATFKDQPSNQDLILHERASIPDASANVYGVNAAASVGLSGKSFFKIVPVKVWARNPERFVYTYAFIDEGSNVNMCSEDLVKKLGVSVSASKVELVTSNATSLINTKVDGFGIQGVDEPSAFFVKDALVVKELVDVSSSIPTREIIQNYKHLQDANFPLLEDCKVEILLGTDLHQAYLHQDVLVGKPGEPCGLHTALGWVIYGKDGGDQEISNNVQVMVNFLDGKQQDDSCSQLLKILEHDFQDVESAGVSSLSQDDRRALAILDGTVEKINGHYSVGLLWKEEQPELPNNKPLAERRLKAMKKRFLKDPDLFKRYSEKMEEYISNYAEPVSEASVACNKLNYIPHHCTSGNAKFRVVFDCSARWDGKCLNDQLLHGPDLTNNLVGVLLRFRQYPFALIGDIKGMFSQVLVNEEDRDALRFLWFKNHDLSGSVAEYRMRSHVFGAKSSPCCAAYALRKAASDNETGADADTVETVASNIYVDDLCKSCPTRQEAIELVTQLRQLLASGGFKLTKFLSNDKDILLSIPQDDLAPSFDVGSWQLPVSKTLGVVWDPEADELKVRVRIKEKPCTRRGLLSMIGQTHDPLGIIQPFLLPARQLLQQACLADLGWDEPLSKFPDLEHRWHEWFKSLPELQQVSVPRCFLLSRGEVIRLELHAFSDASTQGYGVCVYIRAVYADTTVRCLLVMGKSRVAPVKRVTVPRLELVAAVLSAKLCNMICRELDFTFNNVFLWTDASVVLRYILNSSSRFELFVANRVEQLHRMTSPEQWRFVPGVQNPADIASRGLTPKRMDCLTLWFNGPPFLMLPRDQWPEQPSFLPDLSEEDPDVKKIKKGYSFNSMKIPCDSFSLLFARCSSLEKLQLSVAWLLRFLAFLRWKYSNSSRDFLVGSITAKERNSALLAILAVVQKQEFPKAFSVLPEQVSPDDSTNDITEEMLKDHKELKGLQKLSPFVSDGLLRVGGRLRNSSLPFDAKYPILLPYMHPVTNLLIAHHHEKEGHMGVNHVLADINRHYWIIKGRSAVKRAINKCVPCRFWKVDAGRQQMGDLPSHRVEERRPFEVLGTDLMGPVMISIGRNRVKRYVCIFNCLATRAVHFEVVPSLDVSGFLQAFRRFCSRRNVTPTTIYSDNGTNFVAAAKELKNITWNFNPPRSSHQGGFYEVFFRIFRRVFRSIVSEATLNEFDLLTYAAEVERIINNRPITKVPSSPNDWSALTPSMILTGSLPNDAPPNDQFVKAETYKSAWKKTQYLADRFWHQWARQYLPLLQEKQKWFGTVRNFRAGDLVLMMDESLSRGKWPKALVVETFPDKRGLVRRVRVRAADGSILRRDIRKLCLLEAVSN